MGGRTCVPGCTCGRHAPRTIPLGQRAAISAALAGRTHSAERRAAITAGFTSDVRRKISAAKTGTKRPARTLACERCGKSFESGAPNARFCSGRCRHLASAQIAPHKKAGRRRAAAGSETYTAVHKRLVIERGRPSRCEHCGTATARKFEWAYAGPGHDENREAFSANLSDYIRLCTSCHYAFDRGRR